MTLAKGFPAVISTLLLRGRLGTKAFHPLVATILARSFLGSITLFRSKEKAIERVLTVRTLFQQAWDRGKVIVSPAGVDPAPKIGQSNRNTRLHESFYAANISDATALAVPFGYFPDGLPRSVQFQGPPGCEMQLLEIADRFIQSRDQDSQLKLHPPKGL